MKQIQRVVDLISQKKFFEADDLTKILLNKDQNNQDLIFLSGVIKANQKKFTEAAKLFEKFLAHTKDHFDGNLNLAGCYHELGKFEKAILYYNKCIDLKSDVAEVYRRLAMCYRFKREYKKAIEIINQDPNLNNNKEALLLLGNIFKEMGSFDEADVQFKKLLNIFPDFFDGKLAMAILEIDKGNLFVAKDQLKKLLSLTGLTLDNLFNIKIELARVNMAEGDYQNAIKEYSELNKYKRNPSISYNLALCHLHLKNYEIGWSYHEDRINLNTFGLLRKRFFGFSKPVWEPNRPKKNLLIWGEQGIGDVVLQSQFIEGIRNEFSNLSLAVDKKLMTFFQKIYPEIQVLDIENINDFNNYEYHLPTGSMGKNFQKNFNFSKLKNKKKYSCQNRDIPKKLKNLRCGISWNSTNKLFGHKKSIPLDKFSEIFKRNDLEFINLQYSFEVEEIQNLEKKLNKQIFLDHSIDCFNDIDGVACLIQSCDFIITISNTNAHLSGKLGIKTFLLLPLNDGKLWYWGANSDNKIPWYPSIVPIRSKLENNWDDNILSLNNEIEKLL